MAEATIPFDPFNPGQVFACIGFVEIADILLGDAEGAFDWSDLGRDRFHLRARGDVSPVERVLRFLDEANATAVAPAGSKSVGEWTETWGSPPTSRDRALGYPYPDPRSPATVVCMLSDGLHRVYLDHWGDETIRDNVKFWGGAGGKPGSALARDALALVRGKAAKSARDPFAFGAPQTSSFRLDWRRDYIPIDAGFSLNNHDKRIVAVGFPIVELLAAVGLGNARPRRPDPRDKYNYAYAIAGRRELDDATWLPLPFLRASLGALALPFSTRTFRMQLAAPDKHSRAITTVTEENV